MAVLLTPPKLQFLDDSGNPLAYGKVDTFAATGGTFSTRKATYTTQAGTVENSNPVVLDAAGRASIWIDGSYDFRILNSNDVLQYSQLAVTAFTALPASADSYAELLSGNGTQTAFTLSESLGTDEKAILVFVNDALKDFVTNGTFATDTGWTKGSGWTIGSGVATAATASTALSQTAASTLVAGQAYTITYTLTVSSGSVIASIGGTNGASRSSSGTYTESIIAGSTQIVAFTGSSFVGTVDVVSIKATNPRGFEIKAYTEYTINGTTLTLTSAPASDSNNIYVTAPSLLVGAASSAAASAASDAASALASKIAAQTAETNAETNAETAETNAAASAASAALATDWAVKTNGLVDSTDYSAKAWAIGGTGTATNNAKYYSEQAAGAVTGDILPMTEQGSTPSTPASGVSKLYFKTDGQMYTLDDAGDEYRVGSCNRIYAALHSTPESWELPCDGSTVAKTSGATYNGTKYKRAFLYLWNKVADTEAPVITGRGASAQADWDANKRITVPDMRDYVIVGVSGAGSITTVAAKAGATTVTPTGSIAINAVTLSTANLPSHSHTVSPFNTNVVSHSSTGQVWIANNGGSVSTSSVGSGSSFTPTGTFTGSASSVLQKSFGAYFYLEI